MRVHFAAALAAAATCLSTPLLAQTVDEPDPAKVRIRLGPLWINPTMALTNIGIDNNVFNEPEDFHPKRDFTFTLTPAADLWLRMGPSWVVGRINEDVTWYQTYASERNGSTGYSLGWSVPLARLGVKVEAARRNARDRPGFEIDARSERIETRYNGLIELRMLSKTFIGVIGRRQRIEYDKDAIFLNSNLAFELNHTTTGGGLSLRHQLTPLTSISVTAIKSEDVFKFSPLRDSTSSSINGNVTFDRFALVRGGASVGYTDFHMQQPGIADYQGITAAVNLAYTLMGATRFGFDLGRDVQYSYDVNQPYYIQTRVAGSVMQQIVGPLDAVVRGSFATLGYRDRVGVDPTLVNRVDDLESYGGGIGYHMGRDTRLGFNVDWSNRTSDVFQRRYKNLTYGSSVTYGF